jgi:hypothetical protein
MSDPAGAGSDGEQGGTMEVGVKGERVGSRVFSLTGPVQPRTVQNWMNSNSKSKSIVTGLARYTDRFDHEPVVAQKEPN